MVQFISGYKDVISLLEWDIFRLCVPNARVPATAKLPLSDRYNQRLLF